MNFSPSTLSALKQLFYLEKKSKLSAPEKRDMTGIRASVAPLKTDELSEEDKKEVINRLNYEAKFKG